MSSNTSFFRPSLLAALATSLVLLPVPGKAAQSEMTAQSATQIIEGCAAHAKIKGHSHAIAVVDSGGHAVAIPGGIPVYSADGQKFIGAVGVCGEAPADDAACAEAGVRAAGLSLKHS